MWVRCVYVRCVLCGSRVCEVSVFGCVWCVFLGYVSGGHQVCVGHVWVCHLFKVCVSGVSSVCVVYVRCVCGCVWCVRCVSGACVRCVCVGCV